MPRYGIKQGFSLVAHLVAACCRIQHSKTWVFLIRLQDLHFAVILQGSRFQTLFDSWSVCGLVKEAILHVQQELRKEAHRMLKFGSCRDTSIRIEVLLFSYPVIL